MIFLLFAYYLRRYTTLPGDVLRVVVDVYTQAGIGYQFVNDIRHQCFVILMYTEFFVLGFFGFEQTFETVRSASGSETKLTFCH